MNFLVYADICEKIPKIVLNIRLVYNNTGLLLIGNSFGGKGASSFLTVFEANHFGQIQLSYLQNLEPSTDIQAI